MLLSCSFTRCHRSRLISHGPHYPINHRTCLIKLICCHWWPIWIVNHIRWKIMSQRSRLLLNNSFLRLASSESILNNFWALPQSDISFSNSCRIIQVQLDTLLPFHVAWVLLSASGRCGLLWDRCNCCSVCCLDILQVAVMHTYSVLCLITLHFLKHLDIAHLFDTRLQLYVGVPSLGQVEIILCLSHSISHREDLSYFLEITLVVMLVSACWEDLVKLRTTDPIVPKLFPLVYMFLALIKIIQIVFQIVVDTLLWSHLSLIFILVYKEYLVLGWKRWPTFVKMRPFSRIPDPCHHIGIDWFDEFARSNVTLVICSSIFPLCKASHILIILANHIILVTLPSIIITSPLFRPSISITILLHRHSKLQLLLTIRGANSWVKHLTKHAHCCQSLVGWETQDCPMNWVFSSLWTKAALVINSVCSRGRYLLKAFTRNIESITSSFTCCIGL